ncbi:MAG: ACP S-malonyltransferase [Pirellulaceae bacterium]|nr:ACP S-malonyltransferase [Pirellulaceae bacterium]
MQAWIFPGQGSQSAGMARGLLKEFGTARKFLEMAEQLSGLPLNRIRQFGPLSELRRPEVLEPLLTSINMAYAHYLLEHGVEPDALAGYSAGEVAALNLAGVLTVEDALSVSVVRGKWLSLAVTERCKMVAVTHLTGQQIQDAIMQADMIGVVDIAGWNADDQLTIVGDIDNVLQMERQLIRLGGDITSLEVSGPWHSPSIQYLSDRIFADISKISFETPQRPIFTSLSGCRQDDPAVLRRHVSQQVAAPVLWKHILLELQSFGVTRFCELGSGRVLFGLVRRNFAGTQDYEVASAESHAAGISPWIKSLPPARISP